MTAKANLRELLRETRNITHKSFETMNISEDPMESAHYLDICASLEVCYFHPITNYLTYSVYLQKDKRYLILDSVIDVRKKIVISFMEDLARKGSPPPPTASEPNRVRKL